MFELIVLGWLVIVLILLFGLGGIHSLLKQRLRNDQRIIERLDLLIKEQKRNRWRGGGEG
ncbi:hypothetical protein ACP26L_23550 [Paenibacillus sp. S-38]|uniref:hypothetical protein n=1 Tax=Paenibacillus sp. S-38 TaxID=3416710 RepID=UPI003CE7B56C